MTTIYKIFTRADWQAFQASGSYAGSPVDVADGYIHFSTQDQLVETLDKHYAGQSDLEIVSIDADKVDQSQLKWEPARDSLFPHLYTDLPLSAVTNNYTLSAQSDGTFTLP